MKIDYNILWFEDEPEWYKSQIPFIENFLSENGFKLNILQFNGDEDWESLVKLREFDLILMDLKLGDGRQGSDLIEAIRKQNHYTNVVFYSQIGELSVRKLVAKKGIDGVYCSGRENEDFEETVCNILEITIKKVQDINNIRGLVMAEVSNLENTIGQILLKHFQSLKEKEKVKLMESSKKRVDESLKDKKSKFEKIKDFDELIDSRDFDLQTKWRTLKRCIMDISNKSKGFIQELTCLNLFDAEIIKTRNDLAHAVQKRDKGGNVSFEFGSFVFNEEACKKIRKDMQKHSRNLSDIDKKLS